MTTIVTMEQLEAAANAAIDYYEEKGSVFWQNEQNRPLLRDMMATSKAFPGGKENIVENVAGEYVTGLQGFEYDDEVDYDNPGKLRQAFYPWKLVHGGINVTHHELLKNGISVTDSVTGASTKNLSERDSIVLADLFEYKIEDMEGGMSKEFDEMLWGDGSADPKLVPGIRSIILDDPTDNVTVGGIDQSSNEWWRNYANIGINASTASNLNLVSALQSGMRQMRRYGTPKHKAYAGSALLDKIEAELRSKGEFTNQGWAKTGRIDVGVADASLKGVEIDYCPTLDDLGLEKYLYFIDTKKIRLRPIQGEDMKKHTPARPHNKYVLYRAKTWVGGLSARQRNTSGVFSIS